MIDHIVLSICIFILPGEFPEISGSIILNLLEHEVEEHAHLAILFLLDVEDTQSGCQRDALLGLATGYWISILSALFRASMITC